MRVSELRYVSELIDSVQVMLDECMDLTTHLAAELTILIGIKRKLVEASSTIVKDITKV